MNSTFIKSNSTLIFVISFAILVFGITAYNSHGYFHADEHYQIIEFAGLKLGTHTPNELAWEFGEQIRPTLQPTICYLVLKTSELFGYKDPYTQAFVLRLLTALFAIGCITYFIKKTEINIIGNKNKIAYYLISYFLWFTPLISVRFSSETWSGLFLILGLSLFLDNINQRYKPFLIGIALGFSFLFRFQIAFAIIGFILWLLLCDRSEIVFTIKILVSLFLVLIAGTLIDLWFYGALTFTPWNYFYKNIIDGAAAEFGTSPWHYYLSIIFEYPSSIIGILIFISYGILLYKKPKSLLLWCTIPFILGHSIVAHKEQRFLFPIVYLIPFLLMESYAVLSAFFTNKPTLKILNYLLLITLVITNVIGLVAMGQKSAGLGRMEITHYIHEKYGANSVNLIYVPWSNPYNPWGGLHAKFYREPNLRESKIENIGMLNDSLLYNNKEVTNLLVIRKADLEDCNCPEILKQNHFQLELQSIPKWIESVNGIYNGYGNNQLLELYRYNPKQ